MKIPNVSVILGVLASNKAMLVSAQLGYCLLRPDSYCPGANKQGGIYGAEDCYNHFKTRGRSTFMIDKGDNACWELYASFDSNGDCQGGWTNDGSVTPYGIYATTAPWFTTFSCSPDGALRDLSSPPDPATDPPTSPPTTKPTSNPSSAPTSSPTPLAPWIISFLLLNANFTAASYDELELSYEVGKGRDHEAFFYDTDCMTNITNITITPNITRVGKNDTFDSLSIKYDIPKDEIVGSSIWNPTSSTIEFCQVLNLILPESNMVISTDKRVNKISLDLTANYSTSVELAAGTVENATDAVSLEALACKCSATSYECNTNVLPPNSELHVCVKPVDDDVEVNSLVSMKVTQGSSKELNIVVDGESEIPSLTSIDYDAEQNAVRVGTRLPSNVFTFAADASVTVSGAIDLKLAGARKLRALAEGEVVAAGESEGAFELQVKLGKGTDISPGDGVSLTSSGEVLAGAVFLSSVVSSLFFMLM